MSKKVYQDHLSDVIEKLTYDWATGIGFYDNADDPTEQQETPKLVQSLIEIRDFIRLNME